MNMKAEARLLETMVIASLKTAQNAKLGLILGMNAQKKMHLIAKIYAETGFAKKWFAWLLDALAQKIMNPAQLIAKNDFNYFSAIYLI
jgi:hypothetical protein